MNAKYLLLAVIVFSALAGTFLAGKYFGSQNGEATPLATGYITFSRAAGSEAPDFELQDMDGSRVRLSELRGKKVILFFAEGAMCYPSCWNQMSSLSSDARFNSDKVASYSIVVDSRDEWKKIVAKYDKMKGAKILFDSRREASGAYDVLYLESSMHKGGFPGHTYFIIDEAGIIRYAFDDPRMGLRNELLADQLGRM